MKIIHIKDKGQETAIEMTDRAFWSLFLGTEVNGVRLCQSAMPYVEPNQSWINSNNQLPEVGKKILLRFHENCDADFEIGNLLENTNGTFKSYYWHVNNVQTYISLEAVTHWMPIPEFKE